MIFIKFRNSRLFKIVAVFLTLHFLFDIINPIQLFAITGGPSQPEVQSFEPVNTTEMVDLFSGDFVYNIPLLDVGGYPINISYHSGISMEQEASWVGLGWNINPGVINRSIRGLPDDFKGDEIIQETSIRKNWTAGLQLSGSYELFGSEKQKTENDTFNLNVNFGIYYNNYKGVGIHNGASVQLGAIGLSYSYDSNSKTSFTPSFSIEHAFSEKANPSFLRSSIGVQYNSLSGVKDVSFGVRYSLPITDSKGNVYNNNKYARNIQNLANGRLLYSFASPSYTPVIKNDYASYGFFFNAKTGLSFWGLDPSLEIGGYYNENNIREAGTKNAYGYYYHQFASPENLKDLNRENDAAFSKYTRYLPVPSFSYDIYSVAGQGVSGVFRPVRGSLGIVSEPARNSPVSVDGKFTLELGAAAASGKIGGSVVLTKNTYSIGTWKDKDDELSFKSLQTNQVFEPCYFRSAGEISVSNNTLYNFLDRDNPVALRLNKDVLESEFKKDDGSTFSFTSQQTYFSSPNSREKRNTFIQPVCAGDASNFAVEKKIKSYNDSLYKNNNHQQIQRTTNQKEHHFSEMNVYKEDGTRYVYGIPAMNVMQVDAVFSVEQEATPNVMYTDVVGSAGDAANRDKYYSRTEIPDYAHSYLLTAVLSPDYVDVTGNGPTPDDIGTYTKFNYTRVHTNYKWRAPYTQAKYNEMLRSRHDDNMGSYTYGEKEIWYLHSIETKTHVAVFDLEDRDDSRAAEGEKINSVSNQSSLGKLKCLKKISLFSSSDYFLNKGNAVPIKSVHFEYDYSLCQNVPNNFNSDPGEKGKLTLKRIYFTYGNNTRGKYNIYEFNYDNNYDYDNSKFDRWGYYHNQTTSAPKADFPYVDQTEERDSLDNYASAWHLSEIKIPSGGIINIDYEADDYAYVQNKPAMQMLSIIGASNAHDGNLVSKLYQPGTLANTNYNYLFFELPDGISTAEQLNQLMVRQMDAIYFNFLVGTLDGKKDYISGYCEIDSSGVYSGNGFVRLKPVKSNCLNKDINPISLAAFQHTKIHNSDKLGSNINEDSDVADVFYAIFGQIMSLKDIIVGGDCIFDEDNSPYPVGRYFDPDKSWIRLFSPHGKKVGGGQRVKKIQLNDNWDAMTSGSEDDQSYGQEYNYVIEENGRYISSGVASYEPLLGGDENPFKNPVYSWTEKNFLGPTQEFYNTGPIGESFFPSPMVGYRKIIVRNYKPDPDIKKHGTGWMEHEFFTAYDFPTLSGATDIQTHLPKDIQSLNPFNFLFSQKSFASQGYVIILNDMHGKPKSVSNRAENGTLISKTEYVYQIMDCTFSNSIPFINESSLKNLKTLDNRVTVMDKFGEVESAEMGIEFDVYIENLLKKEKTITGGVNFNLDAFMAGPLPFVIPVVLPSFDKQEIEIGTSVTVKIINKAGILQKIIVTQDGASIETENLIYDKETSSVILSSTQNEHGDTLFSFNYPAYWMYDGMSHAYKNTDALFSLIANENNQTFEYSTSVEKPFVPGDEIVFLNTSIYTPVEDPPGIYTYTKCWVLDVNYSTNEISLINQKGENVISDFIDTKTYLAKVIKSGRKNILSGSTGSINTLNFFPIENDSLISTFVNVISASATQFSDYWQSNYKTEQWTETPDTVGYNLYALPATGKKFVNLLNSLIQYSNSFADIDCYEIYTVRRDAFLDFFYGFIIPQFALPTDCIDTSFVLSDQDLEFLINCNPPPPYSNYSELSFQYASQSTNSWNACPLSKCMEDLINIHPVFKNSHFVNDWQDIRHFIIKKNYSLDEYNDLIDSLDTNHSENNLDYVLVARLKDGNTREYLVESSCSISPLNIITPILEYSYTCVDVDSGVVVNPFITGIKGIWRPKKEYIFLDKNNPGRSVDDAVAYLKNYNKTNMRFDGLIDSLSSFWTLSSSNWSPAQSVENDSTATGNWIWNTVNRIFDPNGFILETKNILGLFSSALYAHNGDFVIAISQNSQLRNMFYDGFEDYLFDSGFCRSRSHWYFDRFLGTLSDISERISSAEAHTGDYSYLVPAETSDTISIDLSKINWVTPINNGIKTSHIVSWREVIPRFKPIPGEYILSYWIKNVPTNDTNEICKLYEDQQNITLSPTSSVDIIVEEWKRVDRTFTLGNNADELIIVFDNHLDSIVYIDDIRIFPIKANMKSYVYNPLLLRLVSILDENNFAVFFEYDREGNLVLTKVETEKGIFTIKETRQSIHMKTPSL